MEVQIIAFLAAIFGFMMTIDHRVAQHEILYFLGMALLFGSGSFLMLTAPPGDEGIHYETGEEAPFAHLRTYRVLGACIVIAAAAMLCHKVLLAYRLIH